MNNARIIEASGGGVFSGAAGASAFERL